MKIQANIQRPATLKPIEAAALSQIGINEIYRLLHTNQIPHIKVGNRFIIPRAAFLAWLESSAH
jgi:excisionase family DNA binding protein